MSMDKGRALHFGRWFLILSILRFISSLQYLHSIYLCAVFNFRNFSSPSSGFLPTTTQRNFGMGLNFKFQSMTIKLYCSKGQHTIAHILLTSLTRNKVKPR